MGAGRGNLVRYRTSTNTRRMRATRLFAFEAEKVCATEFQQAGLTVHDEEKLHPLGIGRVFGRAELVFADPLQGGFAFQPRARPSASRCWRSRPQRGRSTRYVPVSAAYSGGVVKRLRAGIPGVGVPPAAVHQFDDRARLVLSLSFSFFALPKTNEDATE